MKNFFPAVIFILASLFLVGTLIATSANADTSSMSNNAQLIIKGKGLFFSKSIGTNGLSCASCHVYSVGTYINMHGKGKVIKPIKNAVKGLTAMFKKQHAHTTFEKKIDMCVRMALKGHLSKGDLEALSAYVKSLK
ncbi:MAG TPA: hypothetical protein ENI54_01695 [bacterium]|nr:hypothetical protein [bacterium]